jgi:hypothetical protein
MQIPPLTAGISKSDLEKAITEYLSGPPFPVKERARFRAQGFIIHEPGLLPCLLPVDEWEPDSFVAVKDGEARISLIVARRPGTGAWTRLLARLKANRLQVTIIAPMPYFEAHLQRIGFSGPHVVGSTFEDRHEEYRLP